MDKVPDRQTKVLIVDDHIILRDGLISLFRSQPDFEVVGEAGTVAEALQAVDEQCPDLILMDYSLPDGSGLDATRAILADHSGINIVFLTVHEEDDSLFAAVRSGAKGYLLKNIPAEEMLTKLRGLRTGEAPLSDQMASRLVKEFARTRPPAQSVSRTALLTPRELEVLREIARGASNKEIGARLHISVHTVRNHVHHILAKLDVPSRRAAARILVEEDLL